jgi:hypothetical protein
MNRDLQDGFELCFESVTVILHFCKPVHPVHPVDHVSEARMQSGQSASVPASHNALRAAGTEACRYEEPRVGGFIVTIQHFLYAR